MLNKAMVIGNLGQDPELKYTPAGNAVANLSVGTNKRWTDKNGNQQENTQWHRIVVWGIQAETANQYLLKGSKVYVEGELETRKWTDKNGVDRYTTEIKAHTVKFLDKRGENSEYDQRPQSQRQAPQKPKQQTNMMDKEYTIRNDANFTADEIPF